MKHIKYRSKKILTKHLLLTIMLVCIKLNWIVVNFKSKRIETLKLKTENISEKELKIIVLNSNFTAHVLENYHSSNFDVNQDLEISKAQNKIYINFLIEELHIQNEVKKK